MLWGTIGNDTTVIAVGEAEEGVREVLLDATACGQFESRQLGILRLTSGAAVLKGWEDCAGEGVEERIRPVTGVSDQLSGRGGSSGMAEKADVRAS